MIRASRLPVLVLAGLVGFAPGARAVPTVDLSWNNCSPIVPAVTNPVAGPHHLFVSVTGQEAGHQSYQVFLYVRSAGGYSLPDAWRFDATGCQGPGNLEIRHLPPGFAAKSCPAFQGTLSRFQIKDYVYDPATGRARLVLVNTYPPGVAAPDPATRYFLLDAIFDHTNSVVGPGEPAATCGGFERDIVVSFLSDFPCQIGVCTPQPPTWLDLQGMEHDFAIGQGTATFCGSCAPVPATATTWGQIKGAYRR
jgi:hypothetical protein